MENHDDYKMPTFEETILAIKKGLQDLQEREWLNDTYIEILKEQSNRFREALEKIKNQDCFDPSEVAIAALEYRDRKIHD